MFAFGGFLGLLTCCWMMLNRGSNVSAEGENLMFLNISRFSFLLVIFVLEGDFFFFFFRFWCLGVRQWVVPVEMSCMSSYGKHVRDHWWMFLVLGRGSSTSLRGTWNKWVIIIVRFLTVLQNSLFFLVIIIFFLFSLDPFSFLSWKIYVVWKWNCWVLGCYGLLLLLLLSSP